MAWDQGFPNSGKGWRKIPPVRRNWKFYWGIIFLPDEGNLRRNDFANSNLFQS